jgi:hypothetical protein
MGDVCRLDERFAGDAPEPRAVAAYLAFLDECDFFAQTICQFASY